MTTDSARGFTIIEVILFLAISGAIFSVLMIGVGTGIAQQRYIESVRSFKTLLQNEFDEVQNTRNGETADIHCDPSSRTVVEGLASRTPSRGSSSCVMLGRAIQLTNGSSTVKVSSVVGFEDAASMAATADNQDDVSALQAITPQFGTFQAEDLVLDWGSYLRLPGESSGAVVTILIMRSPSSGNVRVFASTDTAANNIISDANSGEAAMVDGCIIADGVVLPHQLVRVNPALGTAEAVKIAAPDDPAAGACQT